MAANDRDELEADLRAAEAALAVAQAEFERGQIRAPISGIVSSVPVETGVAVQANDVVAEIIALDPMLAVVEVAERQLAGVKIGDPAVVRLVTGATAEGNVRFVSPTASEGTRTYRVDIELDDATGIPDGITAEVAFRLAPVEAVQIARSALTFSSEGTLSVRAVDAQGVVRTLPVEVVEDSRDAVWVAGIEDGTRVIVQGQDFVSDGQVVEPVETAGAPALISSS
jgi:multidrug efflux system membrane fusion protein